MRKKRKSGDGGFNVWRSYSDVMAGVLLLFILIMSLTLFQAQKSYDEILKEYEFNRQERRLLCRTIYDYEKINREKWNNRQTNLFNDG